MGKKILVLAAVVLAVMVQGAWAQEIELEDLIASTTKLSEDFEKDFNILISDLDEAINSEEKAKAKFKATIEALRKVEGQLDESSDIWKKSESLLAVFEENMKHAQTKIAESKKSDYWRESAEDWQNSAARLRDVRDAILDEKARLASHIEEVLATEEITIDMIKRKKAKKAIKQMTLIKDDLKKINDNLKSIVDKTKKVEEESAAPAS